MSASQVPLPSICPHGKQDGHCPDCNTKWWSDNRVFVIAGGFVREQEKREEARTYREVKRERPWGYKAKQYFPGEQTAPAINSNPVELEK